MYAEDLFTFNQTNVGNCGTSGLTCIAMTQCMCTANSGLSQSCIAMSNVYADNLFTFNETNVGNCSTAGSSCIAMTRCVLLTVVCLRVSLP